MKSKVLFVLTGLALVIMLTSPIQACTFFVAGPEASEDGSILIARTEDFHPNIAKHIIINESETHEEGATIVSQNGLEWELPEETYRYISVRDYEPIYGRFHSTAINSQFVGISATTTTSQNDLAREADPLVEDGLGENIVVTLVAQRAKSAREAIALIGEIIETKGASETFGLAVADQEEVWFLENGGGHRWVAARVPDNKYFVGANAMRIGHVDLECDDFMGSPDLIDFAIEHGLYDPETHGEFHFAEAYGTAREYRRGNYMRVWGGVDFFNPSQEFQLEDQRFPLFLEPEEKISVDQVMEFMRYHYQGTEYDTYGEESGERGIGTSRTIHAHVMQMKTWLPPEIGAIQWIAVSTPLASPFVPYFLGLQEIPKAYQIGDDAYDDISAFWAFRTIANLALSNYQEYGQDIRELWEDFEEKQFQVHKHIIAQAQALYEEGEEEAMRDLLTSFNNGQALRALDKAYRLREDLITDLGTILP